MKQKTVGVFPGQSPKAVSMVYFQDESGKIKYTSGSSKGAVVADNYEEFEKMVKSGKLKADLIEDGKVTYKYKSAPAKVVEDNDFDQSYLDDELNQEFDSFEGLVEDEGYDYAAKNMRTKVLPHWKKILNDKEYEYFEKKVEEKLKDSNRKASVMNKNLIAEELIKIAKSLVSYEQKDYQVATTTNPSLPLRKWYHHGTISAPSAKSAAYQLMEKHDEISKRYKDDENYKDVKGDIIDTINANGANAFKFPNGIYVRVGF
jgi:hypothetical protein